MSRFGSLTRWLLLQCIRHIYKPAKQSQGCCENSVRE